MSQLRKLLNCFSGGASYQQLQNMDDLLLNVVVQQVEIGNQLFLQTVHLHRSALIEVHQLSTLFISNSQLSNIQK